MNRFTDGSVSVLAGSAVRNVMTVSLLVSMLCLSNRAGAHESNVAAPQTTSSAAAEEQSVSADVTAALQIQKELVAQLQQQLNALPPIDSADENAVERLSRRGDLHLFSGQFQEAVADYQAMIQLRPELDRSHWRLGIAQFYAGNPEAAAAQFDRYHAFDDVDRENGIWRYLSYYRACGPQKAREELLRYTRDDRPPFPEVYRLFEGNLTAQQVLAGIAKDPNTSDGTPQQFYADLYIGMHAVVQKKTDEARPFLLSAMLNTWPRNAGYGPGYMWHVARLQYFQMQPAAADATPPETILPPGASVPPDGAGRP